MVSAVTFPCRLPVQAGTLPLTIRIEPFNLEAFAELMDDEFDKVRYERGYVLIDLDRTRYWCDPDGNCYRVVLAA